MILTYSGRTPEILSLVPYLPSELPLIAITAYADAAPCPLFAGRFSGLCTLLPAPIPCSEVDAFGVPTPTSSTTTALALTDALALVIARQMHASPPAIFHHYHPGGAIGASVVAKGSRQMESIAIKVDDVPIVAPRQVQYKPTILEVILAAASSPSGWVRTSPERIIAPRQIQWIGRTVDLNQGLGSLADGIIVEKGDWISIPAAYTIQEAQDWILHMRQCSRGRTFLKRGTVLGIVDGQQCVSGVVEIEDILDDHRLQDQ